MIIDYHVTNMYLYAGLLRPIVSYAIVEDGSHNYEASHCLELSPESTM
jgi:hypothetical protein